MNIFIVRAFIKLREIISTHKDLVNKMDELEKEQKEHGQQIAVIYSVVKKLISEPKKPKRKIGFDSE